MPFLPAALSDVFESANNQIAGTNQREIPGFTAPGLNSSSGNINNRQSRTPSNRTGFHARNIVRWFVPETGIVEMYINPQAISYDYKKHITPTRTKGGYLIQYWGEELGTLNITGTTGSSGIEGINVLRDVYRAEQVAFDPYALALAADRDAQQNDQLSFNSNLTDIAGGLLSGAGKSFLGLVGNALESGSPAATRPTPTLANLAFSVEMYWSGSVYRGYFTNFRVEESADRLGLFNYTIGFTVTQERGVRQNFLGWHRSPIHGPSNSDPEFGPPYSFSNEGNGGPVFVPAQPQGGSTLGQIISSPTLIAGAALGSTLSSIF